MNVRITNIQNNYIITESTGYLLQKENRQYATNFTGSAGVVLIAAHKAIFITDFRYVDQAKRK